MLLAIHGPYGWPPGKWSIGYEVHQQVTLSLPGYLSTSLLFILHEVIGGGVALVPGEDDLLELVGSDAKGGHPDHKLGQKLGLVGRVHL